MVHFRLFKLFYHNYDNIDVANVFFQNLSEEKFENLINEVINYHNKVKE